MAETAWQTVLRINEEIKKLPEAYRPAIIAEHKWQAAHPVLFTVSLVFLTAFVTHFIDAAL